MTTQLLEANLSQDVQINSTVPEAFNKNDIFSWIMNEKQQHQYNNQLFILLTESRQCEGVWWGGQAHPHHDVITSTCRSRDTSTKHTLYAALAGTHRGSLTVHLLNDKHTQDARLATTHLTRRPPPSHNVKDEQSGPVSAPLLLYIMFSEQSIIWKHEASITTVSSEPLSGEREKSSSVGFVLSLCGWFHHRHWKNK